MVLSQVFDRGRTCSQNRINGIGMKPRGGIQSAPVANIKRSLSVMPHRPAEQKHKLKVRNIKSPIANIFLSFKRNTTQAINNATEQFMHTYMYLHNLVHNRASALMQVPVGDTYYCQCHPCSE